MASYTVYATQSVLTVGARLLFVENAQLPHERARQPSSGDDLAFEMPNGERFGGSVVSADGEAIRIEGKGRKWVLRPSHEASLIRTAMASTNWEITNED